MAFTASFVTDSVMGKYRIRVHDVTADAAAGYFDTGLKRVTWCIHEDRTITTFTCCTVSENVLDTATAAAGYIAVTGVVSGDKYRFVSFGPS